MTTQHPQKCDEHLIFTSENMTQATYSARKIKTAKFSVKSNYMN
ncbi:hypothetical protein CSB69_0374 [Morganella morganii]|nr:hypothetical protein CSB69_0374 [Morganella morganii]EMP51004.1 hypothetical protein C790_01693 [Morganella morganii SC01]